MCTEELNQKIRECGVGYGMDIYSDAELFSIVTGVPANNFQQSLEKVFVNPMSVDGIGKKLALKLRAVRELAKRMYQKPNADIKVVHGPEDAAHFAMPYFKNEVVEHFAVILLNTKHHILGLRDVSIGSLSATVVHPREVFRTAVIDATAAIILIHNHPSGDPTPSKEDIQITNQLVNCGKMIEIPVIDHIIIGGTNYVSIKEKGSVVF